MMEMINIAVETNGGTWVNVAGNDEKAHVNIYNNNPRETHDSIHINIDYDDESFSITEKNDGKTDPPTDCKCYLTTACMKHFKNNFEDDCYELRVLRWFRDNFVMPDDIKHYYQIAPVIVAAIEKEEKSDIIYDYIYDNVVDYCVESIVAGEYDKAYLRYKNSILALEEQFARQYLNEKLVNVLKSKTFY